MYFFHFCQLLAVKRKYLPYVSLRLGILTIIIILTILFLFGSVWLTLFFPITWKLVKDIKVHIFEKGISQGIYLNRSSDFWLKSLFLRNCQKVFIDQFFLKQGLEKTLLDKNLQKIAKAILMHLLRDCFLNCLINFLFLKILTFVLKTWIFGI